MKNYLCIIVIFSMLSCIRKEQDLPIVITSEVSGITLTSVNSGGRITDAGSSEIINRGICWNTAPNPSVEKNKLSVGKGSGSFITILTGLSPNTIYYVRAFAINESGTSYGNEIEFKTSEIESWMEHPYYALPENGLALMVGQKTTIYGDAIINVPIKNNLEVSYTCDIGYTDGNNFIINPSAGDAGVHTLTMSFKSNGYLITSRSLRFNVYHNAPPKSKNILLIGDSTMPPDIQQEIIKTVLTNSSITFLGTIGSIYKNEGYPGASWNGFLTGAFGKFTNRGSLNIPAYFSAYSIPTPDYIYIRLGINDTFHFCEYGKNPITDESINTIISNVKRLVNAFLDYDKNMKIILGIPTISENSGAGWAASYGKSADQDLYIEQIHRYWQSFIEVFANGKYNSRVDCSYDAIFLDRDNGYQKTNNVHINGIHPAISGYEQLGKGMAMTFNKLMNTE